jgi:hypothetical protein
LASSDTKYCAGRYFHPFLLTSNSSVNSLYPLL